MNINQLMKQAASMQKKMEEMQQQISNEKFEGKSGGGLVFIEMSGNGEMHKVNIDPTLLKEDEKEMLEDLLVAAYNDAKKKADAASSEKMGGAFGDLSGKLPPGMKMPF